MRDKYYWSRVFGWAMGLMLTGAALWLYQAFKVHQSPISSGDISQQILIVAKAASVKGEGEEGAAAEGIQRALESEESLVIKKGGVMAHARFPTVRVAITGSGVNRGVVFENLTNEQCYHTMSAYWSLMDKRFGEGEPVFRARFIRPRGFSLKESWFREVNVIKNKESARVFFNDQQWRAESNRKGFSLDTLSKIKELCEEDFSKPPASPGPDRFDLVFVGL